MTHRHSATRPITDDDIDAITEATRSHERSVLRRLVGLPVRGRVAADIDRELSRLGIIAGESESAERASR